MLVSKTVGEGVSSVLASLRDSDLESAKRKLESLSQSARNEKERGSIMAAAGIYAGIVKGKDSTIQSWNSDRVRRAARAISASQMSDDFDKGYAETLVEYASLTQKQA